MSEGVGTEDALESDLDRIVADALEDWDRLQGQTPEVLYHYTDVAGLIGICSSRLLRVTNLRFMNDARELEHPLRLMRDVLAESRAQAAVPAQLEVIDQLERRISVESHGYPDFYSASFTADGDLLSQWRGYGSSGGGYAIGFDSSELVRPPSPFAQPKRFLNRVIYDEATQLRILRGVADSMLSLFATLDPSGSDLAALRASVFSALAEVVGFAFSFKDPAWAEEQEWRAVYTIPEGELEGIEFRPMGGVAVPYIDLDIGDDPDGRLPIREIVLGPRVDSDTAIGSLELLLASSGHTDVEITVSSVPLRG